MAGIAFKYIFDFYFNFVMSVCDSVYLLSVYSPPPTISFHYNP